MNTNLLSQRALGWRCRYIWGLLLLLMSVATAQAQTVVYGLGTVSQYVPPGNAYFPGGANVGDQGIVPFDTASARPTVPVTGLVRVTGVTSGSLVGMDFRPSTGQLYALGYNATTNQEQLYLLNALTGATTPVGAPNTLNLGPADRIGFDFNPVDDIIRVVSSNGTNIRLNPSDGTLTATDGTLAYAATDRNAGLTPGVGTAAYTNSFAGSTSTTLYDIDELNSGILAIQNLPNSGTLNTVRQAPNGSGLRIAKEGQPDYDLLVTPGVDVDISYNTGQNKAYLVEVTRRSTTSGLASSNLYILNLATGVATHGKNMVPAFSLTPFDVFDIAVPIKPTIISLVPNSATAGDPGLTLTVNGTGFFDGATVFYNGSARATTFVSTTQVTALIPATDLLVAGTYNVTVRNAAVPNGPGGVTAPAVFTVNPLPLPCNAPTGLTAGSISSTSATVDFTGSATALLGYTVTTTPATTTQTLLPTATSVNLTGLVPSTVYTVSIVSNCAVGNNASPATVTFTTNNAAPTITSLSPAAVTAGAAAQTLTVNGSGFVNGSTVSFAGSTRATTFVSATQLTIGLTAADQATPGTYAVTVTTPAPGGGTSAPATFTVNPAPCNAPSGLAASGVTSNSATVTFTGSGTATGYTVTTSPATTTQPLSAGATSVNFSGLTPSTAYTVSIVSNCAGGATSGAATVGFTTTAASPFTITWNGFVSDEWTNPNNWQPNQVPTSADDVFIPGTYTPGSPLSNSTFPGTIPTPNQPVVRVAGQTTRNLLLNTGASLTIVTPGTLTVNGDFTNNGNGITSNSTGRLLLAGPTVQTVGGSSLTTFPNLTVGSAGAVTAGPVAILPTAGVTLNGNLTIGSGQPFTLRSDATGTAYVVNNSGAVATGVATVQRYITPTNPGAGYRHYSSPVTRNAAIAASNTVADLATATYTPVVNGAYNSAADPRLVQPYPTVFYYDQARLATSNSSYAVGDFDNGFLSPGALTDVLATGRGYTVNTGSANLVDFQGTLNTGSYPSGALARGAQSNAGWQLLGNPYPGAINYDVVRANSTGMESALYVFKSNGQYTGSYTSYVNGLNTNTGTSTLPVGQGFFMRVAVGQTGSVNFTNTSRLTAADNTPFQRTTADPRPRLTLALGNAALRTQSVVYFETGATAAFDRNFDAHYLPATNGLTLATETPAGELLSISGQPALAGAEVVLPLQLASQTAGTYTLAVDELENLPAGYHAYLRDALTGTYTDLATTPTLSLTLAPNAAAGGRYALLFTNHTPGSAPAALAKFASVYPNPAHGSATLLLPAALRGQQATAVSVVDNLGRVVLTRTLAADAAETLELPLAGLATGVYSVQAHTATGLVVRRLVVE